MSCNLPTTHHCSSILGSAHVSALQVINRIKMKIIIIVGLLATALSQNLFQMGFTADAELENFNIFDLNGDGIIHMSDMFSAFRRTDKNDDGYVSLQEFTDMNQAVLPPLQTQIFFNFMDNLDSAVDGILDSSLICTSFSLWDADNNRKAVFEEYKNFTHRKIFCNGCCKLPEIYICRN